MSELVRTPVRITGIVKHHTINRRLVGHEATAYAGDGKAADLLGNLLRLSDEATAQHSSGYVNVEEVTYEPIALDEITEKVLL